MSICKECQPDCEHDYCDNCSKCHLCGLVASSGAPAAPSPTINPWKPIDPYAHKTSIVNAPSVFNWQDYERFSVHNSGAVQTMTQIH